MPDAREVLQNIIHQRPELEQPLSVGLQVLDRQDTRIRQLESLLEISAQLNATLDYRLLLRTILQRMCDLLDAEASSIFLADEENGDLVMALATTIPEEIARTIRVPCGQGIVGATAMSGQPVLVPDVNVDPRFYQLVDSTTSFVTRSILCVPLRIHTSQVNQQGEQILGERIIGAAEVLNKRSGPFTDTDVFLCEALAAQAAVALETSMLYEELHNTMLGVVSALAEAIDAKDDYTHGHSARVAKFSEAIGRIMHLPPRQLATLRLSALLHDVGKIGIPDHILNSTERLSPEEVQMIQQHTEIGYRILYQVPALREAVRGMREHHEWYNGQGYPCGLAGEEISLIARIIAVADAFDAMTSDRVYRNALPLDVALLQIHDGAGTQFDPVVVQAFEAIRLRGEITPWSDACSPAGIGLV